MNKEQQIEFIRERCIESNPSIKDLVFGCRIITSSNSEMIITGTRHLGFWVVSFDGQIMTDTWVYERSIEKIIGRPIRLADVLLAIKAAPKGYYYRIWPDGFFADDGDNCLDIAWKLKEDDLTLQSDETISWLFELLGGKDE